MVLQAVIRAEGPDQGPEWPAFLKGGAVLRIMDAQANVWLPRALRTALGYWRYHPRDPPPPQPKPHANGGAGDSQTRRPYISTPDRPSFGPQTANTGSWERTNGPRRASQQAQAP